MGDKQSRLISSTVGEGDSPEQVRSQQACESSNDAVHSASQSAKDSGEASTTFCSGIDDPAQPEPTDKTNGTTEGQWVAGHDAIVPSESEILARLVQLLGQLPTHSMALADMRDRLPPALHSLAEDTDSICRWLRGFTGLLEVTGEPGAEVVILTVGKLPRPGSSDTPAPVAAGKAGGGHDTGSAGVPLEIASAVKSYDATDNHLFSTNADCPTASSAADEEGLGPSTVQLRGLPFRATVADIKAFLGGHAANLAVTDPAVRLLLNRDGRPSGFARVQFASADAARACRESLHRQQMGDRYVEVLTCSDRAGRSRNRRMVDTDEMTTDPGSANPNCGSNCGNSESMERERVLQECRDHMRLPGRDQILLSMLGIALSTPARAYLRRANLGLKHFLARFPGEFRIEGPKGCERVLWAGAGPGPLGNTDTMAQVAMMNEAHVLSQQRAGVPKEPSTPKVVVSPMSHKVGLPHSAQCVATPSDWGTPGHMPQTTPDGITQTVAVAAVAAASTMEMGAFPAGGGPWPPYGWPTAWPAEGTWPTWPGIPPAVSVDQSGAQASSAKKRSGRPDAPTSRSHAHLHPQSHPFAHKVPGSASGTANSTASTNSGAGTSSSEGEQRTTTHVAALRLRGLPFSMTVQDVLAFFAQHDVADRIVDGPQAAQLLPKANGRPSGQAVVQMRSRYDAEVAQSALCNQWISGRYIEVFVYGEEGEATGTEYLSQAGNAPGERCGIPAVPLSTAAGCMTHDSSGQNCVVGTAPWNMPAPWTGVVLPPMPGGPAPPPGAGSVTKDGEDPWSTLFNFLWQEQDVAGNSTGVTSTVSTPCAASTLSGPHVPAVRAEAANRTSAQSEMPARATLQV